MTEAYMEGFAKMAEECGIDPHELMKQAQLFALARSVPKAFRAAKAMRAASDLGWGAPMSLARHGLGTSVLKNLSVMGQRADKADKLRKANTMFNKAKATASAAGSAPAVPGVQHGGDRVEADGSIVLRNVPRGPLAKRTEALRGFIRSRYPGYAVGF